MEETSNEVFILEAIFVVDSLLDLFYISINRATETRSCILVHGGDIKRGICYLEAICNEMDSLLDLISHFH
jgi:hypothetical protein